MFLFFFFMVFVNYCDSFTSWRRMTFWEWGILLKVTLFFQCVCFGNYPGKYQIHDLGSSKNLFFHRWIQQWQRKLYFYDNMSSLIIISLLFLVNVSLTLFWLILSFLLKNHSLKVTKVVLMPFSCSQDTGLKILSSIPVPHILLRLIMLIC